MASWSGSGLFAPANRHSLSEIESLENPYPMSALNMISQQSGYLLADDGSFRV